MNYTTCIKPTFIRPKSVSEPKTSHLRQKIAFIDHAAILDTNCIEIIIIQPERDGIEQITEVLADRENVASLQIIGSTNMNNESLQLGMSLLNIYTLEAYIDNLQQWQNSLSKTPEILLYGCFVEIESIFQSFIQRLSIITKADIGAYVTFTDSIFGDDISSFNSLLVAWNSKMGANNYY